MLCRSVLGPQRASVVYGWVFVGHQIGGAVAAFGAAILRVQIGDYAAAFYISGAMCIITSYFVLQIAKNVPDSQMRT
jgi:sugar phosphate permease